MTLNEYQALAQRTASTKTMKDKIGHGVLGLIGEAGEIVDIIKKMKYMGMPEELAREKLVDEAGDFSWYLVELCTGLGYGIEIVFTNASTWHTTNLTVAEAAVDLVGRAADLYVEDTDNLFMEYRMGDVEDVVCCYLDLLDLAKIDGQEVLTHNIDKLRKRYPEGFDAERSNVRYEHK